MEAIVHCCYTTSQWTSLALPVICPFLQMGINHPVHVMFRVWRAMCKLMFYGIPVLQVSHDPRDQARNTRCLIKL